MSPTHFVTAAAACILILAGKTHAQDFDTDRDAKAEVVSDLSYETGGDTSWRTDVQEFVRRKKEEDFFYTLTASAVQDLWDDRPIIFTGQADDIEYTGPQGTEYVLKVTESPGGGAMLGAAFALSLNCPETQVSPVWEKVQEEYVSIGDNVAVAARISRVKKTVEDDVLTFTGYGKCVSLEYIPQD